MSTRASIIIKEGGNNIYLYHHSDGYISGVGVDLRNFIRGYDEDCRKNLYAWDAEDIATKLVHRKMSELDVGYQVAICLHGDEEYVYVIDCDKRTLTAFTRPDSFPEVETFGEWSQTLLLSDTTVMLVKDEVVEVTFTDKTYPVRAVQITEDCQIRNGVGSLNAKNAIDLKTEQRVEVLKLTDTTFSVRTLRGSERDKYIRLERELFCKKQ